MGMYCAGCGNQLPDDAKFCSKCGKQTGATAAVGAAPALTGNAAGAPQPQVADSVVSRSNIATVQGDGVGVITGSDVNVVIDKSTTITADNSKLISIEEEKRFRELVRRGLEYTRAGGIAISIYKKKPRDQHLREAEEGYNGALAVIGQLEQHPILKGKRQEERMRLMEGDIDLQKLISLTYSGMGALEYFRKNYFKCIENFHKVVSGGIPAGGPQMKETLGIRDGYLRNIRAEDFDSWVKIKKELLREQIDVRELSFFEKRKYKC
jgi:hypothetical protein